MLPRSIAGILPCEFLKDAEARARLVREAQAAAALDRPNICTVFGVDEAKAETFIAMASPRAVAEGGEVFFARYQAAARKPGGAPLTFAASTVGILEKAARPSP